MTAGRNDRDALAQLLARSEGDVARGDVGRAVDRLYVAAAHLATVYDPASLARASWLASMISLAVRDQAGFERQSASAVTSLRLAGNERAAAAVARLRGLLLARRAACDAVARRGVAGLVEVLGAAADRLIDVAAGRVAADRGWEAVDRDRAVLPALIDLLAAVTGRPSHLATILAAHGLDPTECTIVTVLLPLAVDRDREARARAALGAAAATRRGLTTGEIARLCFADERDRARARERLAPAARLRAGYVVTPVPGERDERFVLDPSLVARIAGAATTPAAWDHVIMPGAGTK